MDPNLNQELEKIRQELHSIIGKLDAQADEIRVKFRGIGNEHCAAQLQEVAKQYRQLEKRLAGVTIAAPKSE